MKSRSNLNDREYIYKDEKRYHKRCSFYQPVYYPRINGKSIENTSKKPIIEIFNISEGGIGFKSRIKISINDILNITIQLDKNPSFEVMALVKWTGIDDHQYVAGAAFYGLNDYQSEIIKKYSNSI